MPRRKRKTPKSQSPSSQASADRLENLLDPVHDLLENNQPFQALEVLERIPRRYQHQPEYLYVRGSVHQQVDNLFEALQDLETAVRKVPHLDEAYLNLAVIYADLEYFLHSAQAAEKYINSRPEDLRRVELAQTVLEFAQQALAFKAERAGFSKEKFAPAA